MLVKLSGEEHCGRARDVTDPAERRRCGDLMGAKYVWDGDPDIGLTYEAWCYDVPAIAVEFDGVVSVDEESEHAASTDGGELHRVADEHDAPSLPVRERREFGELRCGGHAGFVDDHRRAGG